MCEAADYTKITLWRLCLQLDGGKLG